NQHQGEESPALIAVGEQSGSDPAAGQTVTKREILVRNRIARTELYRGAGWSMLLDVHLVAAANGFLDVHARADVHLKGNVVSAALRRPEIGDLGARAGQTLAAPTDRAHAAPPAGRIETRSYDHRKHEFEPTIGARQSVKVMDGDVDFVSRFDVGDRLGKEVGPFLRQQRGHVALVPGFAINRLRFVALTDDSTYAPLADGHEELVHRRVLRQGKDVHRLDLAIVRIVELLDDLNRGNGAVDGGLDFCVLEGNRDF